MKIMITRYDNFLHTLILSQLNRQFEYIPSSLGLQLSSSKVAQPKKTKRIPNLWYLFRAFPARSMGKYLLRSPIHFHPQRLLLDLPLAGIKLHDMKCKNWHCLITEYERKRQWVREDKGKNDSVQWIKLSYLHNSLIYTRNHLPCSRDQRKNSCLPSIS